MLPLTCSLVLKDVWLWKGEYKASHRISNVGEVMAEGRRILVEVELPSGLEVDERTLSKAIRLALIEILAAELGITEEEAEWLEEEVKRRLRKELLENQQ